MLIIKGNVQTSKGPVPVDSLKIGDLIVDHAHRARKLLNIAFGTAGKTLSFERNQAVVLSADTILLTAYGERSAVFIEGVKTLKDKEVVMKQPNDRIVYDKILLQAAPAVGYNLTIENGTSVFVNGYCVKL